MLDSIADPGRPLGSAGPAPALHASFQSMTSPSRHRRLLTIGHSYVIALNRRLAHEMARVGRDSWDVTAVAPRYFRGDLRPVTLERDGEEPCELEAVSARMTRAIHLMFYGHELKTLLRSRPWDLIHCWEEPYIFASGQIAWWAPPEIPLVYWAFQNLVKHYPPPFSWIDRYCLDRCTGWIACGESIVPTMLERGYGRKPHRVLPLGVDVERYYPDRSAGEAVRRRLGWSDPGPPVVGYLGRFVPEKGIALLMETLDATKAPWRALFVGGGPMDAVIERWAAKYPGRVVVVRGVSHSEVPAFLNAMDILAAPSLTRRQWREQFGRMLIEAFACGVPVIASDSGEIPFVVADAGRIVGEADRPGWLKALSELLENPELRRDFAARGLERVRSRFTWPIIARRHLDFFDELLDLRASRT